MSKNITIQEGGVARSFGSVDKLQTSLQGGGTCLWVPEDETKLTTKHVSKNGTYTAASDGHYGYSKVTVNVPGGSGSANSSGKPSTLDGGDIAPGGAGSAIVGTDPETGNEQVVGVDEQGNLVTTSIPSGIWVRKPPDDTEYQEGETIIFDGIVVSPIKKDQSTFVDERYLAGKIPFEELIFPVEVAPEPSGEGIETDLELPTNMPNPFFYADGGTIITHQDSSGFWKSTYTFDSEIRATGIMGGSYYCIMFASETPGQGVWADVVDSGGAHLTGYPQYMELSDSYTLDGKTVYYARIQRQVLLNSGGWVEGVGYHDRDYDCVFGMGESTKNLAWAMRYGTTVGGTAEIPVQWKSPYDGRTFEDTFEITVTGSSHSTESSSGTEGSGGGGEF